MSGTKVEIIILFGFIVCPISFSPNEVAIRNNNDINYRFVQRGSGVCASDTNLQIRWFMNKNFRLALLSNRKENALEKLIDFTRYDLPAKEPADPSRGQAIRNWSLMNRLNQKGTRPQDKPIKIDELTSEEKAMIKSRYPKLLGSLK